jgi:3-hydroxyacyl-[acyl-carrier-protein] dehydratase
MNLDQIKDCIPHRSPFLWLDEVIELTDSSIKAIKHLPEDLPVFTGHYPGQPIFPGVLQCEACFQAGAVLIARTADIDEGLVPVVTRQNNTQFRRIVRPGETLTLEAELTERLANAFYLKGKVSVEGKVSVRLEFVCAAAAIE